MKTLQSIRRASLFFSGERESSGTERGTGDTGHRMTGEEAVRM